MEWKRIVTQSDADALLDLFGGFHDGCLHELHLWTGYSVNAEFEMRCPTIDGVGTRVVVQRQFDEPSAIELAFSGVRQVNVVDRDNRDNIIFGAAMIVRDGLIYWAAEEDWMPESPEKWETTFIAAKELAWREASDWMGESFRVGLGPPK